MEPKCNLIIDSCCDLPYELVNREGVDLIYYPYILSDGEHVDDFYQTLTPHDFYEGMRNGEEPSTAQVPVTEYQEAFERAIESGVPTVFLSFTSGLSGSFDAAALVYKDLMEEHPDAELYIVDTLLASTAEAIMAYEAIRLRDEGLTAKELVDWAETARFEVQAAFMVDDLEVLRRGGRISGTVAFAGSKLDVKPLLGFTLDGELTLTGAARGRKKAIKALADFFRKNRTIEEPGQVVVVGNADCPKDLERLENLVLEIDDSVQFVETNIGPTIGTHVGPGMLSLVFWGNDRRKKK